MVKKATKKLLNKIKKKVPGGSKRSLKGVNKKRGRSDGVKSLSSRLVSMQKKMRRTGKRKSAAETEDVDSASQARVAAAAAAFSVTDAGASNAAQRQKARAGSMDLDSFMSGGFEDLVDEPVQANKEVESEPEESSDDPEEIGDGEDKKASDDGADSSGSDDDDDENEVLAHQKQLEALKQSDPEFHRYLQSEGKELLNFGADDDEDDEDEDDATEEAQTEDAAGVALEGGFVGGLKKVVLTSKMLVQMEHEAFEKRTIKGLKVIIQAFKSACHATDVATARAKGEKRGGRRKGKNAGDDDAELDGGAEEDAGPYRILASVVFQRVITSCLRGVHETLCVRLGDGWGEGRLPTSTSHWRKHAAVVKSFCTSLAHLVLRAKSQDASLLRFVLQHTRHYVPYFASFPHGAGRKLLKGLLALWGMSEDGAARLGAFLRIRELALAAPPVKVPAFMSPMLESCIKGAYLTYVRGAKFYNERAAERVAMQRRCVVELFGLDFSTSYQIGFVYIRQLALHLRAAIGSSSAEAIRNVYSWQYIMCLRLWASVVSAYPGEASAAPKSAISATDAPNAKVPMKKKKKGGGKGVEAEQLGMLAYPLIQVAIGVIRLAPTPRYYPVRLHCAEALVQIARSTRLFVPLAPLLLDVFGCAELISKKPKPSTAKPPRLELTLRLAPAQLSTAGCQDVLVARVVELLEDYLETYRFSIGAPELFFPAAVALRAFSKRTRVTRWRVQIKSTLRKIEGWARTVQQARRTVDFGPASALGRSPDPPPPPPRCSPIRGENTSNRARSSRSTAHLRSSKACHLRAHAL